MYINKSFKKVLLRTGKNSIKNKLKNVLNVEMKKQNNIKYTRNVEGYKQTCRIKILATYKG